MSDAIRSMRTTCCIAGGGPAGIMLGYLLARAGIDVVVLEKWPDFFRDFRGDMIHPSTLAILEELGLLEEFLRLPHNETKQITLRMGGEEATVADFTKIGGVVPFLAFIPQWDFLNFLAEKGRVFPHFHLLMETEATELIEIDGVVAGLRAKHQEESIAIMADLVVGADGRHSRVREAGHFVPEDLGGSLDVLWFRLSRKADHEHESLGIIGKRHMMVLIDRDSYWQCAFLIHKGDFERIKGEGLEKFREKITSTSPMLKSVVEEITSWDQVKLLSVSVDRLREWYKPGVICIGDAAHAMSPIAGVGINLAIADAVAAANVLIPALQRSGGVTIRDLEKIQQRRALPTRLMQRFQLFVHKHVLEAVLQSDNPRRPLALKLFNRFPILRRIPARIVGFGFRAEHVRAK